MKISYTETELRKAIDFLERTYDTLVLEKKWVNHVPHSPIETCILFAMPMGHLGEEIATEFLKETINLGWGSFITWNDSQTDESIVVGAVEDAIDLAKAILYQLEGEK